ncbi:MAG: hypothetical protein WBE72_11320 [Terracidiphilus sp.]
MQASDVPAHFTGVHVHQALGVPIHFCFQADVDNHTINIVQNQNGISLKVQECEFQAIVEWIGHAKLSGSLYQPDRWHVGFVQNLTAGAIVFRYGAPPAQGAQSTEVLAAIAPRTVPCKDSGSAGTWYDPSPFSLKRLGVPDEFASEVPLPQNHPARTSPNVRYIKMGDAPGTGAIPLTVPCASSHDPRGVLQRDYTISWTDPLNTNLQDPQLKRLHSIDGHLSFRTCLAMSSEPNIGRIKTTTLFCYLYYVDWDVDYSMNVNHGVVTQGGRGARVVERGLWTGQLENPIVTAPDANESVSVRFL